MTHSSLSFGAFLEFVARVIFHIHDAGWVMVRYCGLYANACQGKIRE